MVKDEVYSKQFFEMHKYWRKYYSDIADWLWLSFKPRSVIDFGCGNGFIISELRKRRASVIGLEGSKNAIENIPENVRKYVKTIDITRRLNFGKYDLAISSEVAEHLSERSADVFLSNLTSHSDLVYFTAAEPRQGGLEHMNEQPHEYWIEKFNMRGFILLMDKSKAIRKHLEILWDQDGKSPSWFVKNSMVFRKAARNDTSLVNRQFVFSRIGRKLHIYILRRYLRMLLRRTKIKPAYSLVLCFP